MKHFLAALQFITILPIGPRGLYAPREMIAWFPLVGLAIGILLSVFDWLASQIWSPGAAAVLDVVFLMLVTGAFHLDGLGDTADGLYGHRDRERALAIMKDSRIGTMALVAVVACLALKTVGIAGLQSNRPLVLLLVPAYARGAMLFGIHWLPYGRSEEGTGYDLFGAPLTMRTFAGFVPLVGLSTLLGWPMVILNLFFLLIVGLTLGYFKRKIGCITGDMLGAMTESTEALLFFVLAMRGLS
ncbi:MAG: adenosylcobinamide-GDP ribazoletransferase [Desulfobacterales bacterium]|nr:adenosylcobinamide-GDP ribazoletransferase [Desulfobacterales bacterium]